MKLSLKRPWLALLLGTAMVFLGGLGFVRWRALRALRGSAQEVASEQNVRFVVRDLSFAVESGFEWVSGPAVFTQAAEFRGSLFICGPAGLLEYDSHGTLLKHYRVGRELPSSPLVRMAEAVLSDSREPELVVATAGEGVLAFNGRRFRQVRAEDAESRAITAILPLASGRLLMGTHKKGVLVYDGKRIAPLHSTLARVRVTELAGSESDLWVGTLDRGVLRWHAGQMEQFAEKEGLPDAQVHALVVSGERTYVGTALGVAEFERGRLARVLARDSFAQALLLRGATLLVGTVDQGVRELALEASRLPAPKADRSADFGPVRQLFESEGKVYALAQAGPYVRAPRSSDWRRLLEPQGTLLADRNVSALAVDNEGRLWVGYFDRGLDVVEPDGQKASHFENDYVFCVNRIVTGGAGKPVAVATANGLALFDRSGSQQQVLGRAEGLIANHVTDVVPYKAGMALATPAGVTFLDSGGARSLYAFHGLVNNHVYALASAGDRLLAGTLGGISVLDDEQIVGNYTTATSGLKHNWITAIVPLGREWIVGTYGAGIMRLDTTGRVQPFEVATAPFEVNPNAMVVTDRHVFAGSVGKGLYVYIRESGRWRVVQEGLPSANVTALAAKNGYLYVGTDNGLVRIPEQDLDR